MADFDWRKYLTGGGLRKDAITGLQPEFRSSLEQMIADAPPEVQSQIQVTSAYRSPQTQAGILADSLQKRHGDAAVAKWNDIVAQNGGDVVAAGAQARPWLKSIGETKWVAPPGGSNHQKGDAVDFKYLDPAATQWAHENAPKYGLNFPLSNEDWHVEPAGIRSGSPAASTQIASAVPTASVQTASFNPATDTTASVNTATVSATPTPVPAGTMVANPEAGKPYHDGFLSWASNKLGIGTPTAQPDQVKAQADGTAGDATRGLSEKLGLGKMPSSLMGMDINKGAKAFGAFAALQDQQQNAINGQLQQVAAQGAARAANDKPVEIQAQATPTFQSSAGGASGLSPDQLKKLQMLLAMQKQGGLGGFGGIA